MSDEMSSVRRVTLCGMSVNVALSALKAAVGWLAGSQALTADAVHSVSDLVTDFAVLLGVKYWTAPADEEHPYGHGKIQAVVASAIGLALVILGAMWLYGYVGVKAGWIGPTDVPGLNAVSKSGADAAGGIAGATKAKLGL